MNWWDRLTPEERVRELSLLGGDHDQEELRTYAQQSFNELPSGLRYRLERSPCHEPPRITS